MSNQAEENGYKIIGPVRIGPAQCETAVLASDPVEPLPQKLKTACSSSYPGSGPSRPSEFIPVEFISVEPIPVEPIPVRPIPIRPICVPPETISPHRADSSQSTPPPPGLLNDDPAQILQLGSQLIAAARREAGQIVADAVEEAEAVARQAEQSALIRSFAIEADTTLRLANIRDSFIQASVAELLELIESAVVAVVGELVTPPSIQQAFSSPDTRSNQSADLIAEHIYGRLLRSRIARAVRKHLPGCPAEVFIHPADYERLVRENCISMPTRTSPGTPGTTAGNSRFDQGQFFSCDPSIPRGDARIRTGFGSVEISLAPQLEMVLGHISSSAALRDSLIAFLEAEDA